MAAMFASTSFGVPAILACLLLRRGDDARVHISGDTPKFSVTFLNYKRERLHASLHKEGGGGLVKS